MARVRRDHIRDKFAEVRGGTSSSLRFQGGTCARSYVIEGDAAMEDENVRPGRGGQDRLSAR
eukprot:15036916-Alexandrium_andersonii.AAC.1